MEMVNIHKAKTNLSALIERVLRGEKIIIARNGEPLVSINRIPKKRKDRVGGKFKGKIWMAPDFDQLPPEFDEYVK